MLEKVIFNVLLIVLFFFSMIYTKKRIQKERLEDKEKTLFKICFLDFLVAVILSCFSIYSTFVNDILEVEAFVYYEIGILFYILSLIYFYKRSI